MQKYFDTISNSKLFNGKTKEEIEKILPDMKYRILEFKKKQVILNSGEICTGIYMILEGEIEVQKNLESGRLYSILYKKPGDTFGGAVLFSDTKSFQVDLMAETDCKLLQIPEDSVRNVLCADSRINSNMMNIMANTVMNLNKRVELFAVTSIRRKIAFAILNALGDGENGCIDFPISKKQWAEHLNVSRPSLSRELKKLQDENIIEIEKGRILIKNTEYLKEIIQND